MTDAHDSNDHAPRPSLDRLFGVALRSVLIAWIVAFLLVTAGVAVLAREMLLASSVIATASGAIAAASMLPGWFFCGGGPNSRTNDATAFPAAAVIGIVHRLAGTVALFLLCRYYMAPSAEMIAGLTIGWYLFLTSVEVVALSLQLPKSDQSSLDAAFSLAADT